MQIIDHHLTTDDYEPIPLVSSPFVYPRPPLPEFVIIHYTAGYKGALNCAQWFRNPLAFCSAHVIIGRDGAVVQCVPFDRMAWHAGASRYGKRTSLNRYSFGIELDNFGYVYARGGKWQRDGHTVANEEVMTAKHKNPLVRDVRGWQTYTAPQLEAAADVCRALLREYGPMQIVGHDDISTSGKLDPGPAFDWELFRAML